MRDNASEYKSEEMMQFLESRGIRSHLSTPKEQWQNCEAESTINSIMMSARTVMAESGLGGKILVKGSFCRQRCPKCNIQGTDLDDAGPGHVW